MAYKVKAGDKLYNLYGPNWKQLSGYTGDPTKLQIGTELNDLPTAGGTSAGTGIGQGGTTPPNNPTPTTPNVPTPQEQPNYSTVAPAISSIPAGNLAIDFRKKNNMPSSTLDISKSYRDYGLEDKYGAWKGSAEQWKALGIEDVNASFQQLQAKIAKKGITDDAGNVLLPPADSTTGTGETGNPTYEYTPMSGNDFNSVMDSVVNSIGTTDLTKLIADYAGGELTDPELELDKDAKDAALNDLKSAAAQGLSKIQQGMAAKGMTFSSIRSDSEAALAADTLSKEAGIGREFAGKIINAARQEQTRRETALKTAETNYNKALEAGGYYYNVFTNTIERTLERQKFEDKPEPTTNYPASYDEWSLAGGEQGTGMSYSAWLQRKDKESGETGFTMKDFYSAIDKGKTDLQQGESWGNVWNRIKQQFPNISSDQIDSALGISWREEGAYQKWVESKKGAGGQTCITNAQGVTMCI